LNFFSQFLFQKFPIKILLIYIVGSEQEALNKAEYNDTTLTAWFKLNQIDNTAHTYFYHDTPNYYTFSGEVWKKRKKDGSHVIARMFTVRGRTILFEIAFVTC
jgi:hypothetical protein